MVCFLQDGRSDKAIDKALELIGEWKAAFGSRSGYKAVNDVFGELEREGFFIPEPQVASAAFIKPAPEWVISDHCHMCRQEFNRLKGWFPVSQTPLFLSIIVDDSSPFQTLSCVQHLSLFLHSLSLSFSLSLCFLFLLSAQHHCRNCGKSVCTQCSTKRTPLPEFGIKQPTRVCDICYKAVAPDTSSSDSKSKTEVSGGGTGGLPEEYLRSSLAKESQVPQAPTEEMKMKEEDDLQLAIAMSLNEQDNKVSLLSLSPSLRPCLVINFYCLLSRKSRHLRHRHRRVSLHLPRPPHLQLPPLLLPPHLPSTPPLPRRLLIL